MKIVLKGLMKRQFRFPKIYLLFVVLISTATAAFGQKQSLEWYEAKFPKEHAVKLLDETNIVIGFDENGVLTIKRNLRDEKLLLTNQAGAFTERQILYSSFFDITDVEAASYIPRSSGSYSKKRIEDFRTEKIMSDRVFHDDLKAIKFEYADLQEGAKIDLSYTEDVLNPFFIPPAYFQDAYFVEKIKVTLEAPENVKINIQKFNLEDAVITYKNKTRRGVVTHTWEVDDVPRYKDEGGAPSPSYFIPHISFMIEGYNRSGEEVPVLRGVADLYKWYNGLLDSVDHSLTESTILVIDSISKNYKDDLTKAKALYDWVRTSVKYIAVEDGLGGFIPDNPAAVSVKRFGDCKGMSCLLATMMRKAGLDAHECWIGTRDIPYRYTENYTPFADNHMITAFKHENEWLFLDATDGYVPFGYPSAFIQGKEALIGIDEENFELVEVPVVDEYQSVISVIDTLKIEGELLRGSAKMTLTGYDAARFKRSLKKSKDDKRFFKYYLQAGNDKFEIKELPRLVHKDSTVELSYDFVVPDYVRNFDGKYFLNLSMDRLFADVIFEDRKLPLEREYKHSYSFSHFLIVPKGFKVVNLPKSALLDVGFASANIEYSLVDNLVNYKMDVRMNSLLMQPEQSEDWNDFVKSLRKEYRKNIELIKSD